MAKLTIVKWQCDRCGLVADKWDRPIPYIDVAICQDYDVGPGPRVIWKEMCADCTKTVGKEFEAIQASAKQDRRAVSKLAGDSGKQSD